MAVSGRSLEALRRLGAGGSDDRGPTATYNRRPARREARGSAGLDPGRCRSDLAKAAQPSGEVLAAEPASPPDVNGEWRATCHQGLGLLGNWFHGSTQAGQGGNSSGSCVLTKNTPHSARIALPSMTLYASSAHNNREAPVRCPRDKLVVSQLELLGSAASAEKSDGAGTLEFGRSGSSIALESAAEIENLQLSCRFSRIAAESHQ